MPHLGDLGCSQEVVLLSPLYKEGGKARKPEMECHLPGATQPARSGLAFEASLAFSSAQEQ